VVLKLLHGFLTVAVEMVEQEILVRALLDSLADLSHIVVAHFAFHFEFLFHSCIHRQIVHPWMRELSSLSLTMALDSV
jgi:hypothetical protein